jgi:apolipoprotein D and lipocalin family protein
MKSITLTIMAILPALLLNCCSTIPRGAIAVKPFDKEKYLGKWYEIARFDFRFERNLNNTTATYSINENGTIKVDNRGFNYVTNEWSQATGKAKFAGAADEAKLKVSFFGPFYGGYNVIALDDQYKYALIAGSSLKYLWILSRETSIPNGVSQEFLRIAKNLGYDTSKLIWVEHNRSKE